ncbi:complement C1q tumor necrosis factor-related protein 3-like [Synchiropus splendidus]|uniref:complement C1q tumor necrosis factor-related protein 3-like n=1 Tax=Synchiropus splendidus TaxID=270530 RepID=UPI00237EE673|nr:complement C1q tumor necrosis factor-related protein 3-like [Synchiropus splendidus]
MHGEAVLFFATHLGSLRDQEYNPIVLDQVLVNVGAGYDVTTGVFTAPVSGVYQFVFAAQLCRGDHNNLWEFRLTGGRTGMVCHAQVSDGTTTLNTCYYMVELQKGDRVWMCQRANSCAWASSRSRTINFSGVLLSSAGASRLGGASSSCPLTFMNVRVSRSADLRPAPACLVLTLVLVFHLMLDFRA